MQRHSIRGVWNNPAGKQMVDPPIGTPVARDIKYGRLHTLGTPTIGATFASTGPLCLGCGGDSDAAALLEKDLQRPLDGAVAFTDNSTIEANDFVFWLQWPGSRKLVVSQTLTEPGWDMAATAGGSHDGEYQDAVDNLLPYADRILAVRIGWEFNVTGGYPWTIGGSGTNQSAANYAACFRRFAKKFREKMPHVLIDWCPLADHNVPDAWYPGDEYVDIIGNDVYQKQAFHSDSFQQVLEWNAGLYWQEKFASAHGKMMGFPEWATDYDTQTFVYRMAEFMYRPRQVRVAYQGWWNTTDSFSSAFKDLPNNYRAYKEMFGEPL